MGIEGGTLITHDHLGSVVQAPPGIRAHRAKVVWAVVATPAVALGLVEGVALALIVVVLIAWFLAVIAG